MPQGDGNIMCCIGATNQKSSSKRSYNRQLAGTAATCASRHGRQPAGSDSGSSSSSRPQKQSSIQVAL
jgi:hypothetical protein